jgi:hypothetical protein
VQADAIDVYTDGVRATGNVVVHVDRAGQEAITIDATADRATIVLGKGADGQTTVTQVHAVGKVHLDATSDNATARQRRHIVTDTERAAYIASQEVVHLYPVAGQPVVVKITETTEPTAENGLKETREIKLDTTARRTFNVFLKAAPAGELALPLPETPAAAPAPEVPGATPAAPGAAG